jgi:hypothetical protein
MTGDTLTRAALNRATLARQLLLRREKTSAADAVARLCGMQAQEAKPPFLGLWSRVDGFAVDDLHAALHDHSVVRGMLLRATLHLATAADYTAFRPVIQPVLTAASAGALRDRAKGLDPDKVLPAAVSYLEEAPRTFTEIRAHLSGLFPAVNERALGYTVRTHVPMVMVPTEDRWAFPSDARFTLASSWLDEPLAADTEPDTLVRRYLAAFGPATAADVQTWSGLKGIAAVLKRLDLVEFRSEAGKRLYDLPDAPRPDPETAVPARFLPEFDNLVLAHADRSRLVDDEFRGRLTTKNLRVRATFLVYGFVAGTWQYTVKRGAAAMQLSPFRPLPASAASALGEEGEQLLRFAEPGASTYDVEVLAPA